MELDPEHSRRDRLVLRGRAVLDRRTFASGKRGLDFRPDDPADLVARQTSRKEAG